MTNCTVLNASNILNCLQYHNASDLKLGQDVLIFTVGIAAAESPESAATGLGRLGALRVMLVVA